MSRKFRIQQARLVGVSLVMALCSGLFGQQSSVVSEQAYGLEVNTESSGLLQSPDTESVTEQRLAELEEMVRELREKSAKKTLPSVTINGVFQADVGCIRVPIRAGSVWGYSDRRWGLGHGRASHDAADVGGGWKTLSAPGGRALLPCSAR
jgi:hypothetical protein